MHKAIKPLNMLRSIEDSLVIYRLARAPERRVFYIDTGNLPKIKAEQYVRDMMTKFKNKVVYDSTTGEVRDDRKFMTMLEDFWLPRREGGKGTQIETLPGGQSLGQIDDIIYFQKKLYKSLNVPISRLDSDTSFQLGYASEISRDEVKFGKFITRLRSKFSQLFTRTLGKQLVLKGIMSIEEFESIQNFIKYDFARDNYFDELKDTQIINNRMATFESVQPLIGVYVSHKWARKNILKQTDEEMDQMNSEIEEEMDDPIYQRAMLMQQGGMGGEQPGEPLMMDGEYQAQVQSPPDDQGEAPMLTNQKKSLPKPPPAKGGATGAKPRRK
jgi:hypothetical protein